MKLLTGDWAQEHRSSRGGPVAAKGHPGGLLATRNSQLLQLVAPLDVTGYSLATELPNKIYRTYRTGMGSRG